MLSTYTPQDTSDDFLGGFSDLEGVSSKGCLDRLNFPLIFHFHSLIHNVMIQEIDPCCLLRKTQNSD